MPASMKTRSLPLGIDIGSTRIRIAEVVRDEDGLLLKSVAIVDLEEKASDEYDLSARIAQTLRELNIRERRCITAASEPNALLRTVTFPPMHARERERAAAFEAIRHITYPIEEAVIRSTPLTRTQNTYVLGILRRTAMERIERITRLAGLRMRVLDHEAYALQRVFSYADAVLDMGYTLARLYVFGTEFAPLGSTLDAGADTFTQAIARGLSIDTPSAEHRKRTIGLAGSGEAEMQAFTASVGRALLAARNQGMPEIHRLVVTGNGARLANLGKRLERDTGCSVDIASHIGIERTAYPSDITRASAPDWALCIGLALWSAEEEL
jgi:Tfp pilus assembly PilM family ATPase